MPKNHIVKSFDDDLKRLDNIIAEMGGLAETQLANAMGALLTRDSDKANQVVASDRKLDTLETEVDASAVQMLALRQPMAQDLRIVITALRTGVGAF